METLKKVWAWLKKHWMWVVFPIGLLVAAASLLGRLRPRVVTIDPTAKADERAQAEREHRERELQEERDALRPRLEEVRREHQHKLQQLTESQMDRAAELEGDPDALNEWLRSL